MCLQYSFSHMRAEQGAPAVGGVPLRTRLVLEVGVLVPWASAFSVFVSNRYGRNIGRL